MSIPACWNLMLANASGPGFALPALKNGLRRILPLAPRHLNCGMMNAGEKDDLKMVLQGAWVKGIRWFAFGTDAAGISSPDDCKFVGSLSSAFWPFENVGEIGVTPTMWTALDPAPTTANLVAVDDIKAVWVGNRNHDESVVWHGLIYPRR